MAMGGTASWAYFTASATATGSLSTQSVTVTQTGFSGMDATYLPSKLTDTGSFTVTNTGAVSGTATVTIAAPESWASGLPIRVWPTSAGACSVTDPPGSALSGTWAAPPAIAPTLNAGASVTYCVRTTIPHWKTLTSAAGSQQANPVINVSLNAAGWVTTAASATHRQQTAGMYPLTTGFFDATLSRWFTVRANANTAYCLDVSGSGGSGAAAIAYTCHANSNQRWEFLPVSGDQSLVTIRPRHAMGTRLTYSGTNATIATTASATAQQWYVQQIDANRFQLVSAETGLCLALATSQAANATMVACTDASARLQFQREPLTLQTGSSLTLTFGGSNMPAGRLQRSACLVGCSWADVSSIASGSTSVTFPRSTIGDGDTVSFRIVDSTLLNPNVFWDGIRLSRSGNTVTAPAGIG
ncbi:MAG: ricin-type beta-trefoil lectin domain protein [Micropruina sp.]